MTDTPNVQMALQDDAEYGAWRHGDASPATAASTRSPRFQLDSDGKAVLPLRWITQPEA